MVEQFNGRIADVLNTHRFNSRDDMEQTRPSTTISCRNQGKQVPMQAMKEWHLTRLHLIPDESL